MRRHLESRTGEAGGGPRVEGEIPLPPFCRRRRFRPKGFPRLQGREGDQRGAVEGERRRLERHVQHRRDERVLQHHRLLTITASSTAIPPSQRHRHQQHERADARVAGALQLQCRESGNRASEPDDEPGVCQDGGEGQQYCSRVFS